MKGKEFIMEEFLLVAAKAEKKFLENMQKDFSRLEQKDKKFLEKIGFKAETFEKAKKQFCQQSKRKNHDSIEIYTNYFARQNQIEKYFFGTNNF